MVNRPEAVNSFEFIVMAGLRAAQLMRGCVPRVPAGHKPTTTAQLELVAGKIKTPLLSPDPAAPHVYQEEGLSLGLERP